MTTDPGDLVLDPTCGSGTTAYVAEQWGRRWIAIEEPEDALETYVAAAIAEIRASGELEARIRDRGIPWKGAMVEIENRLPERPDARSDVAYQNVPRLLDEMLGRGQWSTEKRARASGDGTTTWIVASESSKLPSP